MLCDLIESPAAEFGVLVRTSHQLAPDFNSIPGCGFSVCSNSAEGLAEKAWECKLTTAQC